MMGSASAVGILLAALLVATPAPSAAPKFDDATEFRTLETALMDAVKAQDRKRLEPMLTSRYVLTIAVAGAPLIHVSREDWLAAAATTYKVHSYEFKEIAVRRHGDVAVVTSYYTQKATTDGGDRSGDFLLTDTWVREGGRWRIDWRNSSEPETR